MHGQVIDTIFPKTGNYYYFVVVVVVLGKLH